MSARVMVAGWWLDRWGVVGGLVDSTIWRRSGYSGDYEASWTWSAPSDFSAAWFVAGAEVRIYESGLEVWRGFLGEPRNGDVWQLVAYGSGASASSYVCTSVAANGMHTEMDLATARGMKFTRHDADFTGGDFDLADAATPLKMDAALDTLATTLGKVWWVSRGEASLRAEATGVDWSMAPNSAYLGSTDEGYFSSLVALYMASGTPTKTTAASDATALAKFGRVEEIIDLTSLGDLTATQADDITEAMLAAGGARMAYTNGFTMTALNSSSVVGSVAAPMSVRAGQRVWLTGITDMRTGVTYHAAVPVTLGKVTRDHATQTVACEPLGMVGRDLKATLAKVATARGITLTDA